MTAPMGIRTGGWGGAGPAPLALRKESSRSWLESTEAAGFTLLEILVAMSLLFVVLATVYGSFQVHVRTIERARQVHRFNQVARVSLSMLARDLQGVFWPVSSAAQVEELSEEEEDVEEEESLGSAELESSEDQDAFFLVQPIEEAGKPWYRIIFLSQAISGGPLVEQYPWVHAVEYRLAKDQDTGRPVLVRRENPAPQKDPLMGGEEWALSEDVVAFEVLCMTSTGEVLRQWDSRVTRSLPAAVLVRLWVQDPGGPPEEPVLYSLRVAMPPSPELPSGEPR
jgi:prepilin-type N-terminal cleavage/methylation domain-containing protein